MVVEINVGKWIGPNIRSKLTFQFAQINNDPGVAVTMSRMAINVKRFQFSLSFLQITIAIKMRPITRVIDPRKRFINTNSPKGVGSCSSILLTCA